jgi:Cupin
LTAAPLGNSRLIDRPEYLIGRPAAQETLAEMDALSELLRVVKLTGAMFFNAQCSAPWCLRSPPSRTFNPYVASPSSHVIEFHLIAGGRGYVRVGEETTPLAAGDIVMMPHGDAHYMGNASEASRSTVRPGYRN